jgi:hypothetical protein
MMANSRRNRIWPPQTPWLSALAAMLQQSNDSLNEDSEIAQLRGEFSLAA